MKRRMPQSLWRKSGYALLAGAIIFASPTAQAQLLGGGGLGGLTSLPGQTLGGLLPSGSGGPAIGGVVDRLGVGQAFDTLDRTDLLDLRRARLNSLVRENRSVLDQDDSGNPIRRDEVLALDPGQAMIEKAKALGFRELRREPIAPLGIDLIVLAPPKGQSAKAALKKLKALDPAGHYELNHIFQPAGGALRPADGPAAHGGASGAGPIGMIDGGVAAHPALSRASIEQRGFTPNGAKPSGHGTAIASLLVGEAGAFHGAARGQGLLVADVYGGQAAAGSAEAITRALGWLATKDVRVINISLVGPPNALLERAIRAVQGRGILIVAAVGNDGPAAPVQYPAAYAGVIAVTAVDIHNRALPEAGRAAHLDFAAPGAQMAAAIPGGGYTVVRGTSFAAPLVAARLSVSGGPREAMLGHVAREAIPGKGKVGRGIVCGTCRILPASVGLKK